MGASGSQNVDDCRIGLISDTHDYFDPSLRKIFQSVSHIVHAGDVGRPSILLELEQIAPVTAVMGNTDYDLGLKDFDWVEVGSRRLMIHHIVGLPVPETQVSQHISRGRADVVVFGHTHRPHRQSMGGVLFVNPGYAGRRKAGVNRSVAILECSKDDMRVVFIPLDGSVSQRM
jgi:hypothetical protein